MVAVLRERVRVACREPILEFGLGDRPGRDHRATHRDIDRAIAELADRPGAERYRWRLEDQRATLRKSSLRNTAALVVSMCAKDSASTPRIRRAFADLAEHHPELAWFYAQLPQGGDSAAAAVEPDVGRDVEQRRA